MTRIQTNRQVRKFRPERQLWRVAGWAMALGAAFVAVSGVHGCSENNSDQVTLFAASSMSGVLAEVETAFEELNQGVDLECIFAGSQTLAMQINQGAPADLFISADHDQILRADGFGPPVLLAENRIVIITPRQPTPPTAADAISHARRIVIAQADVPAGRYTRLALDELGAWEAVEPKIVSYEHSVRGVLTKIVLGQADLGFVYWTDALSELDAISMIEFPADISTTTQAWIAMNENQENANPSLSTAYRFILESNQSQHIFADHGFATKKETP